MSRVSCEDQGLFTPLKVLNSGWELIPGRQQHLLDIYYSIRVRGVAQTGTIIIIRTIICLMTPHYLNWLRWVKYESWKLISSLKIVRFDISATSQWWKFELIAESLVWHPKVWSLIYPKFCIQLEMRVECHPQSSHSMFSLFLCSDPVPELDKVPEFSWRYLWTLLLGASPPAVWTREYNK